MTIKKIVSTVFYEIGYELSDSSVKVFEIDALNNAQMIDSEYDLGDLINRYGVRFNYVFKNATTIFIGYEGQMKDNYSNNEFRIGGTYKF